MAGEKGKLPGIEKFDNTDFGCWRMQIELLDIWIVEYNHKSMLGSKDSGLNV